MWSRWSNQWGEPPQPEDAHGLTRRVRGVCSHNLKDFSKMSLEQGTQPAAPWRQARLQRQLLRRYSEGWGCGPLFSRTADVWEA